jgi:hypothetical protein
MQRAIDVFFYGLFMDRQALVDQGLRPGPARLAVVSEYQLHIGARATLVPSAAQTVWGVVMALPQDEVERLYAEPSVADYRPEAVIATQSDGETVAALCYNLPAGSHSGANKEYAKSLHALAKKITLPDSYTSFLSRLAK